VTLRNYINCTYHRKGVSGLVGNNIYVTRNTDIAIGGIYTADLLTNENRIVLCTQTYTTMQEICV
jgi:hypothetical protein